MTPRAIAVVTGANRGIGQAICRTLAANTSTEKPLLVYATSRKGVELNVPTKGDNEVRFAKLDITDKSSILSFLKAVAKDNPHVHGVDILINNAGINLDSNYNYENAQATFDTNYRGTLQTCQLFLSQGKMANNPGARIVNVSSGASGLGSYSPELQTRFRNAGSIADIDQLAAEFLDAVKSRKEKATGFNHVEQSYSVSKACVNSMTAVLANQNSALVINCCCPGFVATDMGAQTMPGGKDPSRFTTAFFSRKLIRDSGRCENTCQACA